MAGHASPVRRTLRHAEELVEHKVGGPARFRIIVLLAAVLGLDTADKGTVSALAPSLRETFGIGNTEIGVLIAAVSFVGAVFTLPMGVLVDKTRRKRLLLVVISLWTLAMVASGTATSFAYMLATRVFLGAVSAAATPAVASLTGDFFPARERAEVYGLILAGELVGIGLGFLISGEISSIAEWRWSFYVMGLPGAALVWALWRYLPEPARGGQSWIEWGETRVRSEEDVKQSGSDRSDPQAPEPPPRAARAQEIVRRAGIEPRDELVMREDPAERSLWWAVRYVIRIPTYRLLVVASALGYFFFSGVRGFGMIYLTQHYGVSRSVASALAIVLGIGALVGVIAGGRLSACLLDRKRYDARIVVPGVALVAAVLFFVPGIWTRSVLLGVAMLTVGAAALAAANPPFDAARLDIVPPGLWGRAESGRMALRAALEGSAPILFGLLSEVLGLGDAGLMRTFLVMLAPLAVAASLAIPARRMYPRDVATAAASVKTMVATRAD